MRSKSPYPSSNESSLLSRLQETRPKYHYSKITEITTGKTMCPGRNLVLPLPYLYSLSSYKQVLQTDVHRGHVVTAEFACFRGAPITAFPSLLWRSKYCDNVTFSFNPMPIKLNRVSRLKWERTDLLLVRKLRMYSPAKRKSHPPQLSCYKQD